MNDRDPQEGNDAASLSELPLTALRDGKGFTGMSWSWLKSGAHRV